METIKQTVLSETQRSESKTEDSSHLQRHLGNDSESGKVLFGEWTCNESLQNGFKKKKKKEL